MKALYALALSLLFTTSAQAQFCDPVAVGSNRIPITQDTTLSGSASYWICSGVSVTFTQFGFAYIEEDCNVTISGSMGNYMVKPNCTVTLTSTASNNVVVYDNSTTIIDNGSNTMLTLCTEAVVYTYTNAPEGGCDIPTDMAEPMAEIYALYPNPAHGTLNITGTSAKEVRILDLAGREVLKSSIMEGRIDISAVPPGAYLITILNKDSRTTERIVVY